MGGTPISHRQELRKQRIVREAKGSVVCCPERPEKLPQDRTRQIYLPGTVLEQWDGRNAHQPQTGAAKAADSSRSGDLWPVALNVQKN